MLESMLPRTASNDYRGHPAALWVLGALSLVLAGRSLIHFFKDDSGVNSIATIVLFSGDPDPNRVIYMFSALWGSQQLLMVFVQWIVLWRYRSLVPLVWALVVLEVCFRLLVGTIHPLTEEFYHRTPPGKVGNLPMFALAVVMLVLALRTREPARGSTAGAT